MRETLGPVMKQEKNVVRLKKNDNIVREKLHGC